MGMIIFENDPPYERLEAQSAQAIPTSDGVELVLSVSVEGPITATVPVRILLTPEVANALAKQIEPAAGAARRWIDCNTVALAPAGTEMIMPGDNAAMDVELITTIAMEEKQRFAIREGGKTVDAGVVVSITE